MELIVRADCYPNGTIIPLWVTDDSGESSIISSIISVDKVFDRSGATKYIFTCESSGRRITLYLEKNVWNGEWID